MTERERKTKCRSETHRKGRCCNRLWFLRLLRPDEAAEADEADEADEDYKHKNVSASSGTCE